MRIYLEHGDKGRLEIWVNSVGKGNRRESGEPVDRRQRAAGRPRSSHVSEVFALSDCNSLLLGSGSYPQILSAFLSSSVIF